MTFISLLARLVTLFCNAILAVCALLGLLNLGRLLMVRSFAELTLLTRTKIGPALRLSGLLSSTLEITFPFKNQAKQKK